jgi:hypothetical protein
VTQVVSVRTRICHLHNQVLHQLTLDGELVLVDPSLFNFIGNRPGGSNDAARINRKPGCGIGERRIGRLQPD